MKEKVDNEFKKFRIEPRICHFRGDALFNLPFEAITVATDDVFWFKDRISENILKGSSKVLSSYTHNVASRMLDIFKTFGIYGVAICDQRDRFSRKYGRDKAKGRLFQHIFKTTQI